MSDESAHRSECFSLMYQPTISFLSKAIWDLKLPLYRSHCAHHGSKNSSMVSKNSIKVPYLLTNMATHFTSESLPPNGKPLTHTGSARTCGHSHTLTSAHQSLAHNWKCSLMNAYIKDDLDMSSLIMFMC